MKKLLLILLSISLILTLSLSLVACGTDSDSSTDDKKDDADTSTGATENTSGDSSDNSDNKTEDNGKVTYTVYVKDSLGMGVKDARVQLCTDSGCMAPRTTDADGKVVFELPSDSYKAQIASLPDGYSADLAKKYELVGNTATVTVDLLESYTVLVKDQNGAPVKDAKINFSALSDAAVTDAQGSVTFTAPKADGYKVYVTAPDGFIAETAIYTFSSGRNLITAILEKLSVVKVTAEAPDGIDTEGAVIVVYENGEAVSYGILDSHGTTYVSYREIPGKTYTVKVFLEPSSDSLSAEQIRITGSDVTITIEAK